MASPKPSFGGIKRPPNLPPPSRRAPLSSSAGIVPAASAPPSPAIQNAVPPPEPPAAGVGVRRQSSAAQSPSGSKAPGLVPEVFKSLPDAQEQQPAIEQPPEEWTDHQAPSSPAPSTASSSSTQSAASAVPLGTLKPKAGDTKSALLSLARARKAVADKGVAPQKKEEGGGLEGGLEPPEWAKQAAGVGKGRGGVGGSVLREGNEVKDRMAKLMTKTNLHSPGEVASPTSSSSRAGGTIGGISDDDVMAEVFRRDHEARENKERSRLEAEAAAVRAKMEDEKKREEEERESATKSEAAKRERLQKDFEVYEKSEEEMRADLLRKKKEKFEAEEQERERIKNEKAEQRRKEERDRPLTERERKEREKEEWLKSEKERKAKEAREKEEREEEERERQAKEKREKAMKEERERDRLRRLEDSAALKVHEEQYAVFEVKAKAKTPVPFDEIPWPFCNERLLLPTSGDTRKSIKVWSRRWHPDTWAKYEFPEGDRSKVMERVLEVSKDINAALAKYG